MRDSPRGVPRTFSVSGKGLEEDAEHSKPEEKKGNVEADVEDGYLQPRERGPAEDGSLLRIVEEELEVLPAFPVPTGGFDGIGSHDVHLLPLGAGVFLHLLVTHLGVVLNDFDFSEIFKY